MQNLQHATSARTTPRVRAELQASKESARAPAARYGLNAKTVRKWRRRTTTADEPMGPKTPKSTALTPAEEAIVVAFRQKTLLPLDDVRACLKDAIPNLSRSALHRRLQRHALGEEVVGDGDPTDNFFLVMDGIFRAEKFAVDELGESHEERRQPLSRDLFLP